MSTSTRSTNEITEVQYFVFNVIAMLIVLGGLWRDGRLGEVPDALLGLTSVSALTFVLVKRVPPSGTPVDP
ncbi:hypothetical protein BN12_4040009 [Nostocoides japonicum T1-X7]|uniref:Uncharacterized protein n=1 Tax=Nostocoides japonicum T1-X7 TaxID=1194083 RepID=A0A077M2E7_9MICO|nr:hypothetical protein BN12_4040009 [Tetrasphaera japonica T1-X7]